MSWTYSGDPADSDLDYCRDKIGDVLEDAPLLTDEEIQTEIDDCDSRLIACARCARKIAARFSRKVSFTIGRKSKQNSDLAKQYYSLAESLEQEAMNGTTLAPRPFSGTSCQDAIFKHDMLSIPGAETDDDNRVAE